MAYLPLDKTAYQILECTKKDQAGFILIVARYNGGSKFDAGSFINPAALLTFFAAVLYGLWEVLYKKYGVKDSTPPLLLCFILGSYGLAHLFVFWVFFIPFNYFGWEPFRFPSTGQFQLIAFNAFLGTMYNVSFMAALALLPSPVFVSVAGLMTIPLSALSDYLLHGTTLGALQITGVALIVFGFGSPKSKGSRA